MTPDLERRLLALIRGQLVGDFTSIPGHKGKDPAERIAARIPARTKKNLVRGAKPTELVNTPSAAPRKRGKNPSPSSETPIEVGGQPQRALPPNEKGITKYGVLSVHGEGGGAGAHQPIPESPVTPSGSKYVYNDAFEAGDPRAREWRRKRAEFKLNQAGEGLPSSGVPIEVGGAPGEQGLLQKMLGGYKRSFKAHPVATGVGTVATAAWLAGVAADKLPDVWDQITGTKQKQLLQDSVEYQRETLRRQAEMERLQSQMSLNTARLASAAPHIYNEVLAGRKLPQGAVVLGGQPRTDLLNELALGMSQGAYSPSPTAEDQLATIIR